MDIIINGEKLGKDVLDQERGRLQRTEPGLSEKKTNDRVVEQLTRRTLLRQEAERRFTDIPASEVSEEFSRLVAQHGGVKAFYKQFNLTARDEPAVKLDLAVQIKVDRLLDEITGSASKPADAEIKIEYDENKNSYVFEEMVKASHIVKSPDGRTTATTYLEMVDIRKKLLGGADFSETANEYSGCNDRGGDLGLFGRGRMVEEFETVVFSMEPGEVSPVFKTQFGYHVAKVFEHRPSAQKSFEEAKEEIYKGLLYERKELALAAWIKDQKKKALIVVNA